MGNVVGVVGIGRKTGGDEGRGPESVFLLKQRLPLCGRYYYFFSNEPLLSVSQAQTLGMSV